MHRQFGDTKHVGPIWRFAPVEDSGKKSLAQNVQILITKLVVFNVFWLGWAPAHSANPGLPDRVA